MNSIYELANELHAAAVEKGFWDVEGAEEKHIAKMHSELSEALQEDRMNRPMLYVDDIGYIESVSTIEQFYADFKGRKPEGIAAELADFVMMMLDLVAYKGNPIEDADYEICFNIEHDDEYIAMCTSPLYVVVCAMHRFVADLIDAENADEFAQIIGPCIGCIHNWLDYRGIDLWKVIRLKMEYNKARPKLHGRKY